MANYYYSEMANNSITFKSGDFFYIDDESISAASLADITLTTPVLTFKDSSDTTIKSIILSGFNGQSIAAANFIFADGSKIIIADGGSSTTDGANTIVSGSGDDYIDGGVNVDTVSYVAATSAVTATASSTSLNVNSLVETISSGGGGADKLYNIENFIGSIFNDSLTGSAGIDNTLDGALGIDTLAGGTGDDTYIVTPGDTVNENTNGGTDTIKSAYDFILPSEVENLVLISPIAIYGSGNIANNTIIGSSANNILDGGTGADTLIGGTGNDTYLVDGTSDVITESLNAGYDTILTTVTFTASANVENLRLMGTSDIDGTGNTLNNIIYANSGNNTLDGTDGNDVLNGLSGNDTLIGGTGNDTILSGAGADSIIAGDGVDSIDGSGGVDTIDLTDAKVEADVVIINRPLAADGDIITGFEITDKDVLRFDITGLGLSTDDYSINTATALGAVTVVTATQAAVLTLGEWNNHIVIDTDANIALLNLANNSSGDPRSGKVLAIASDTGAIYLDADGNFTAGKVQIGDLDTTSGLTASNLAMFKTEGTSTYYSYSYSKQSTGSITFKTTDFFYIDDESISAASLADITLTTPVLTFKDSSDTTIKSIILSGFNGQSIAATTFIFADGSKIIIADGTSSTTDGVNTIVSGAGADYIDGGVNVDTVSYATATSAVTASASSTSLSVNSLVETISSGGGGADKLYNIENLIGSIFNDSLTGSAGIDNTLDGGLGIDTLAGGTGDDTYIVTPGDTVNENTSGGTDTIKSAYDFILPSEVENLVLISPIAIYGSGNIANNTITGNAANNILDGGTGADTLIGGTGNDTYLVDGTSDVITESPNAGYDTIIASATLTSYTLGTNVENIVLNAASSVTGNALNNIIYSSTAADVLNGGAGTDTLSYKYATSGVTVALGNASDTTSSGGGGADTITKGTFEILEGSKYGDNLTDTTATANTLIGGDGNDTLTSGGGRDLLDGGNGNDVYIVASLDLISFKEITGIDTVRTSATGTSSISTITFIENLTLTGVTGTGIGNTGNNILSSEGTGTHTLDGGAGNDVLNGLDGDDSLIGGTGSDIILGGAGVDSIIAGDGVDSIDGGAGVDVINLTDTKFETDIVIINQPLAADGDTITGFEIADKDVLRFDITGLGLNANDYSVSATTGLGFVTAITAANAAKLTLGAWNNHIVVDTAANIAALNLASNNGGDPRTGKVLAVASDTGAIYLDADGNFTAGKVQIGDLDTTNGLTASNLAIFKTERIEGTSTYALSVDSAQLNEGDTAVFRLSTTNLPVNTRVVFTLTGTLTDADVTGGQMPAELAFYVGADGKSSMALGLVQDGITEGTETLTMRLVDDTSQVVTITVADTSFSPVVNHPHTGTVIITGIPTQGQILSVSNNLSDEDVLGTISYQWLRDGAAISGATGENYTLTQADVGKKLSISASYTDGGGTKENVTSAATAAIANVNDVPTGSPTATLATGSEDTVYVIQAADLIRGFSDIDGDALTVINLSATHGTLAANGGGAWNFTPEINYTGAVTLSYTVSDGQGGTLAGQGRNFTLTAVNDAPVVDNATFAAQENSATGTAIGQIIARDIDNAALLYTLVSGNNDLDGDGQLPFALDANSGKLTVNDGGDLQRTLQTSFTLGVQVSDGIATGNATVTVNLNQKPGVTITPLQTPAITSEGNALVTGIAGGAATFNVVLNTQPLDDNVTLTFTSNNPAEGKPVNSVLTFTPSNWNVAQILKIQGQDDLLDDGDVAYIVSGTVSSSDIDYIRGIDVPNLFLQNRSDPEDTPVTKVGDANGIPTRDRLTGANGADRLYGGYDIDKLNGGWGNDRLYGGYDDDFLYGENGDDELYGEQDSDVLYGNNGADTLDGGLGADTMIGGNGADIYYVDNERDVIDDQGTDKAVDTVIVPVSISYTLGASIESATLIGADNSRLTGNMLANILTGNSGNNTLDGGAGNDTLAGGAGNDTLQGGTGIDTANYATATTAVNVNLTTGKATGEGTDIISTIENILSGKGSDILTGNSSANNLNGGAGNDKISGGPGKDTLVGSAGADIFIYNAVSESGIGAAARDVIKDFSSAQGDKIDLHLIGAKSFITGNFTNSAGQLRFDSANHLIQFDSNGDGKADFEIELTGVSVLSATDLILL